MDNYAELCHTVSCFLWEHKIDADETNHFLTFHKKIIIKSCFNVNFAKFILRKKKKTSRNVSHGCVVTNI
mgnify:CR=1 FL=1